MGPKKMKKYNPDNCLNPYSNGSTTMGESKRLYYTTSWQRLNPYSNGSTTMGESKRLYYTTSWVLILILMEVPQWE